MKSGKVSDHPLVVVEFPVKRCMPLFTIYRFPTFTKPPAKILIAIVANALKQIAIAHERAVEGKGLEKNLMRGLFVVEREVVVFGVRRLDAAFGSVAIDALPDGRATAPSILAQPRQSAFNLCHAFNLHRRRRGLFDKRIKLIAEQMLDVVNQQLLML